MDRAARSGRQSLRQKQRPAAEPRSCQNHRPKTRFFQPCRAQNPSGASRFLRQRQQQMLRSDVAVPQLARKTPRLHDQSPQSSG